MASSLKWSLHVPVKADVPIVPDEKEFVALQTNRVQIARLSGSTYERRPMPISLSTVLLIRRDCGARESPSIDGPSAVEVDRR